MLGRKIMVKSGSQLSRKPIVKNREGRNGRRLLRRILDQRNATRRPRSIAPSQQQNRPRKMPLNPSWSNRPRLSQQDASMCRLQRNRSLPCYKRKRHQRRHLSLLRPSLKPKMLPRLAHPRRSRLCLRRCLRQIGRSGRLSLFLTENVSLSDKLPALPQIRSPPDSLRRLLSRSHQ